MAATHRIQTNILKSLTVYNSTPNGSLSHAVVLADVHRRCVPLKQTDSSSVPYREGHIRGAQCIWCRVRSRTSEGHFDKSINAMTHGDDKQMGLQSTEPRSAVIILRCLAVTQLVSPYLQKHLWCLPGRKTSYERSALKTARDGLRIIQNSRNARKAYKKPHYYHCTRLFLEDSQPTQPDIVRLQKQFAGDELDGSASMGTFLKKSE
ncbi:hypothetical protein CLF_107528 [Clonorchis sinensis]|uniref:Uncharacterized protein n=1 Tax=Clonorchis sinensis TaxID=79923 RepID=G7YQQ7_CLOSI|nr:hypothetical protein CLF_107528 [Clonorchis sinensis]